MKLEEAIVSKLAATRKKGSGPNRYITGSLQQPVFPSLERPKKQVPAMMGLGPLPDVAPAPVVSAPVPEPSAPAVENEFDSYSRNTPVGW